MPYYPQPRKFRADVRPSEHVVITENSHEHRLHKKYIINLRNLGRNKKTIKILMTNLPMKKINY